MEDNDIIQKFILYNIPDNDINKDYRNVIFFYLKIYVNIVRLLLIEGEFFYGTYTC